MTSSSTTTITRLLVANRGEIACRVFATCRRLGIETVAVHSDADAGLAFVTEADLAVRLPGTSPAETYLAGDLVVEAARRAGADAVHPGYGFLSENADFARQVLDAGLTWVGPDPSTIEAMGSKVGSKRLMRAAGVPVLDDVDPPDAGEGDLPLLVKASAGGGGRGMRVVRRLEALAGTVEAARAEAASAFGDGTVFAEPYVEQGRHVEVQVLGGVDGTVHVLGDRDCSVQRRHQKVVEEAPAPGLPDDVRAALHAAARDAAAAVDYRGAGTVEFLYDDDRQRFFFLEMNTRLQVEHPVTEAVTGLDLVALQLAVAEGRDVSGLVARTSTTDGPTGHAVEVRLYAEDPAAGWQPQSGRLSRFVVPDAEGVFTHEVGLRLDSGFGSGDEVGTHYDAMLAKVVAWAPTREAACRRLAGALARAEIHGLRTNRDLLVEVLRHPAFLAGELGTDFLDRHDLAARQSQQVPGSAVEQGCALLAAAAVVTEASVARRPVMPGVPTAWRNVVSAAQTTTFEVLGTEVPVRWWGAGADRAAYELAGPAAAAGARVTSLRHTGGRARVGVQVAGLVRAFDVFLDGDRVDVQWAGGHLPLVRVARFVDPAEQVAAGSLLAPMPGSVVRVLVEPGAEVEQGQPLLVLEAMKMQHTVPAPATGTVTSLDVAPGDQVAAGTVLAVVEADEPGRPDVA